MGLGPPALSLFKFMHDEGLFDSISTVAEIGSQEYDTKRPEYDDFLTRFFESVGADTPLGRDPQTGRLKGPAREFFERLGCSYIAMDIDGRFGSMPFDLNFDTIDSKLWHWAGLTTNLGTTEHVFNQVGCFNTIHDLTRPGGYMVHTLPLHNYVNHGLYSYSPCFFEALAAANDYELLGMWMASKSHPNQLPPALPPFPPTRTLLIVLLRRTSPEDFMVPLQLSNPMTVHDGLGSRYKTTERRHVGTGRHIRYDGMLNVDLNTMSSAIVSDYEALLPRASRKQRAKPGASLFRRIRNRLAKAGAGLFVARKQDSGPQAGPID